MMISIFNGRSRGIGKHGQRELYVQVSVKLRRHLHLFKGAKLAVFMAIALHTNEEGWSDPSVDLLRSETGYNKETISTALTALCALTIEGERILLAAQRRSDGGSFTQNRYLVFPSPEECAKYEASGELRKPRKAHQEPQPTGEPRPEKPDTVEPSTGLPRPEKPSTENMYGSITIFKENHVGVGVGRTLAFLIDEGISAAAEFAQLPYESMRTDYDARTAAGQTKAQIVKAWRLKPPSETYHYGQSTNGPGTHAAHQPARPARATGKHAPTGGSDIHEPGWREKYLRDLGIAED